MNKVIEARANANAVIPIRKDSELFCALSDGKLEIDQKIIEEIVDNAKYLRSLGLVSLFYSDEQFFRIMQGRALDLSKRKPQELSLKELQQIVTSRLGVN